MSETPIRSDSDARWARAVDRTRALLAEAHQQIAVMRRRIEHNARTRRVAAGQCA